MTYEYAVRDDSVVLYKDGSELADIPHEGRVVSENGVLVEPDIRAHVDSISDVLYEGMTRREPPE